MFTTFAGSHIKHILVGFFLTLILGSAVFFIMPRSAVAQATEPTREELLQQIALLQQIVALLQQQLALQQQTGEEANDVFNSDNLAMDEVRVRDVIINDGTTDGTTHRLTGTVLVVNTCEQVSAEVEVSMAAVYPQDVHLVLLTDSNADLCADSLVEREFSVDFNASSEIRLTASRDGMPLTVLFEEDDQEVEGVDGLTVYENGEGILVVEHATRSYAITFCEKYAAQRAGITVSCMWGGEEVFNNATYDTDDSLSCALTAPAEVAYGDTFNMRWTSEGAQYAQFALARSGADGFGLPEGRQTKNGSANVVANAYGDIEIKLSVFGDEGRADCTKTVHVPEPENEATSDIRVYENGNLIMTMTDSNTTKRYAISYCQAYANQRADKTIRCTWKNEEVFYYAPTITNPRGAVISCKVALLPTEVEVGDSYVVSVNSLNSSYTVLDGEGASYTKGNSNDSRTVVADEAGTFTYTAKAVKVDEQGNPLFTATCSGSVTVVEPETETSGVTPSCTVETIPYQTETGRKYTVKWDSTNAEHVFVDGKKMSADGFTSFSKSSAGSYTHIVKAVNGDKSSTCTTGITIIKLPEVFEESASVSKTDVTSERVSVSYANIPFYSYVALYSTEDDRRYDVNDTYIGGTSRATIYLNNTRPTGSYYLRVTREAPSANGSTFNEIARSSTFTIPATTNTAAAVSCSLAGSNDNELVWSSTGADYAINSWKIAPQQYHAFHTEVATEGSQSITAADGDTEYRMVFYSNKGPFAVCTHTVVGN